MTDVPIAAIRETRVVAAPLAGLLAACSTPAMLPPGITSQGVRFPAEFEERPLWREGDLQGYRTRLRLVTGGILIRRLMIRIDQRPGGYVSGVVLVSQGGILVERKRLTVDPRRYAALEEAIGQSRLWATHPQFWVHRDPDDICLDGVELVFERVDSSGYRFSTGNNPCTAPPDMMRVARLMLEIADPETRAPWLQ